MLLKGRLIFDGTTQEAKSSTNPAVKQFIYGLDDGPL
jgi:phospholipid/cholesterol/gamma-HCH transport system ATP-binding protein